MNGGTMVIKLRQVWQNDETGTITCPIHTLEQLKQGIGGVDGYTLIAENLWTNLKDKNGLEIYEGDIVREDINAWDREDIYEVEWFKTSWIPDHLTDGDFEVIGNIYENPELLK